MTKPMTARSVYVRAMASVKVPKGMMLYITAVALREAEGRKSKDLLDMADAAVDHVLKSLTELGLIEIKPEEALADIAMKGDPKHVQVKIIETVIAGMDVLIENDDEVTHWTKAAVRERLKTFLAMLVNGNGAPANGNTNPMSPPPDLHRETLHDYRILGQVIELAQSILREYRRDGDKAVKQLKAVLEARREAVELRADTAVNDFMETVKREIRTILIGVEMTGPNGKSKLVRRKGAPTWAEFDQCLATMNAKWLATARSFVADCPAERLPNGASFSPVAPELLPKDACPQLSRWERFKFTLRSIGRRVGLILGGVGILAALAFGFDLSVLPALPDVASFVVNAGSLGSIGSSIAGAMLTAWATATGEKARFKLEGLFVATLATQANSLRNLLIDAWDKSAADTVNALEEILQEEIATESDIIKRISKTASKLSKQGEPAVLYGDPAQSAQSRRRS